MKKFAILTLFLFLNAYSLKAQFGVNNIAISPAFPSPCDSVTFTITGDHDQGNITNAWLTDTIRNDSVIFTVNAIIPPMSVGGLTPFSFIVTLPPFPVDTFILFGQYKASIPTFPPNTTTDTMVVDTIINVNAGIDTSFCDGNAIRLNAIPPPPGITGTWTVAQGGATFSSSTIHDPVVTNINYGENKFIWTIASIACANGGSDTVTWFNAQKVSNAVTETDFFSCADSTEIRASKPKVGIGAWSVRVGNSTIALPSDTNTRVSGLSSQNRFRWTVTDTNGLCPSKFDELDVEYRTTSSVTIIRVGDTLKAGTAPSYQWYKDGSILTNDTLQNLQINANGTYKVQSNALGCDNGPFSNEIIIDDKGVGIKDLSTGSMSLYPNPVGDHLILDGINQLSSLAIIASDGRIILAKADLRITSGRINLEVSDLKSGVYYIKLNSEHSSYVLKFIKL